MISGDGSKIVYVAGFSPSWQINFVERVNGVWQTPIYIATGGQYPSINYDGTKIAYVVMAKDFILLVLMGYRGRHL